jgi:hypothetical protein
MRRGSLRVRSRFFPTWDKATPTVPHPKRPLLFFLQKQKKPSPTVPHLRLPFIPSWEKRNPHVHICEQRSTAHPPVLEEVEGYKNNFVFSQDFSFKFSRGGSVET